MMNVFYRDRIVQALDTLENKVTALPYADAKACVDALSEIRSLSQTTFEISEHAKHIWNDNSYVLGPDWEKRGGGAQYTYGDVWAARCELIRREIMRKLELGYTIEMIPPDHDNG